MLFYWSFYNIAIGIISCTYWLIWNKSVIILFLQSEFLPVNSSEGTHAINISPGFIVQTSLSLLKVMELKLFHCYFFISFFYLILCINSLIWYSPFIIATTYISFIFLFSYIGTSIVNFKFLKNFFYNRLITFSFVK